MQQRMWEKGFIIGACEDSTPYFSVKKHAYIIEIEQSNRGWLERVQKAFLLAYGKRCAIHKRKNGYFRLTCYSKQVYYDVLAAREQISLLCQAPLAYQLGFLQGVYDAEGHVHKDRLNIRVYSKRHDLILVIQTLLARLGITTGSIYLDKRNDVLSLPIYGRMNLETFSQQISFSHPLKLSRLNNHLRQS